MKERGTPLAVLAACTLLMAPRLVSAQAVAGAIPPSITTPDKVESRIGTLDFKDGAPSKATLEKAYDQIDFTHAYNAFVNTMQGVSLVAGRRGFLEAGVKDNEILMVRGHLGLQSRQEHPTRTLAGDLVEQGSPVRLVLRRLVADDLQHGWRLLPPRAPGGRGRSGGRIRRRGHGLHDPQLPVIPAALVRRTGESTSMSSRGLTIQRSLR